MISEEITLRLEALRLAVEVNTKEDLAVYAGNIVREAEVFYKFIIGDSDE